MKSFAVASPLSFAVSVSVARTRVRLLALGIGLGAVGALGCSAAPYDSENGATGSADTAAPSGGLALPVIALNQVVRDDSSPLGVELEMVGGDDSEPAAAVIAVRYSSRTLNCGEQGACTIGIVQNGATVSTAPVCVGDFDTASATFLLTGLTSGPVGFYVVDKAGHFDSNFGANYNYTLDLSLIKGRGPDGDVINLEGQFPAASAGAPATSATCNNGGPQYTPVMTATLVPPPDDSNGASLQVVYLGPDLGALKCVDANSLQPTPFTVGVVQNGITVVKANVSSTSSGNCVASIPVTNLVSGKIEFYFSDSQGNVDSDYGANYAMDLDLSILAKR